MLPIVSSYMYVPHLLLSRELRTIRESSIRETISEVLSPLSSNSPLFLNWAKVNSLLFQSAMTCFSLASMSFSLTAEIQISCKTQSVIRVIHLSLPYQFKASYNNWEITVIHTSISSLNSRSGASRMFFKAKLSLSTSNTWLVTSAILFQWRGFMALFVISSRRGTISLKLSIVFFKSSKAGQSFKARGSFLHL